MKLAMAISRTEPELVFNAFGPGDFSRKAGDEVNVFLLAVGTVSPAHDAGPRAPIRESDRVVTF